MGTQLETRPRYTPTTTFETFPFPEPTEEQRDAIADAAKRLNEVREGWLNPPGASDEDLQSRTLTNLYNEMPPWLREVGLDHSSRPRHILRPHASSPGRRFRPPLGTSQQDSPTGQSNTVS